MENLTLIEFLILAVIIIYIIQQYSQKDVNFNTRFIVFVTWMLAIGMILFLPFDIYLTRLSKQEDFDLQKDIRHKKLVDLYQFFYYLLFFLCWVLIPIMQGCNDSGYYKFEDRIKYSLKINGTFYLIIAIAGLIFIGIVMKLGLPGDYGLMTFTLSLANCWGIFLIMVLLGYSLVAIPKSHWRTTDFELQMKYLQFKTSVLMDNQEQAMSNLLEAVIQILDLKEKCQNLELEEGTDQDDVIIYINMALDLVSTKFIRNCENYLETEEYQQKYNSQEYKQVKYNVETAVKLYLNVKYKYAEVRRYRCEWNQLKKKAFLMEDILLNQNNPDKVIVSEIRPLKTGFMAPYRNTFNWYWHIIIKKNLKYIYALYLTILSVLIIIDETGIFFKSFENVSILGKFLKYILSKDLSVITVQIILIPPLSYIVFNTLYGFFSLNTFGLYGVYPNKNTDTSSLFFTSINFSRVSAPICQNFLNILNIENCAFNAAIGNINLVPVLGESFANYFPLVLIFLVIFNYFDLYDKIVAFYGLKSFQFSQSFDDKYIDNGREMLRQKREWELLRIQKENRTNPCINMNNYDLENPDKTSIYMKLIESQDSME